MKLQPTITLIFNCFFNVSKQNVSFTSQPNKCKRALGSHPVIPISPTDPPSTHILKLKARSSAPFPEILSFSKSIWLHLYLPHVPNPPPSSLLLSSSKPPSPLTWITARASHTALSSSILAPENLCYTTAIMLFFENLNSDCVTPLFKILQWLPTMLWTKSKLLMLKMWSPTHLFQLILFPTALFCPSQSYWLFYCSLKASLLRAFALVVPSSWSALSPKIFSWLVPSHVSHMAQRSLPWTQS